MAGNSWLGPTIGRADLDQPVYLRLLQHRLPPPMNCVLCYAACYWVIAYIGIRRLCTIPNWK
uniref:Uncharacterized protein n=1 Tax=Anguilla anguilla TaxID=7936 RepID=A0A0E9SR54_ANGAN